MISLSTFRPALLWCLIVCPAPSTFAQPSGGDKAPPPEGISYITENFPNGESSAPLALAHEEANLRVKLADEPDSPALLYSLALIERQEDHPRASLNTYTLAAKRRVPTAQELRSVALDYVLLNDFDDAIHWLEIAVSMNPSDVDILYSLGRCYYTKGRFSDAGKLYRQALAIHPNAVKVEENLGLVYDALNQPAEAEAALRKAVSWANPNGNDEWPFLNLGSFLLDHDQSKEAVEPLLTAERIQPLSAIAHEKLGRALLENAQDVAGIDELEQSARLDPKNPKVHFELGRALRKAGRTDEAKKEFALSQRLYAMHDE